MKGWGGGEREKPLESIDFSRVELDRSLDPFLEKDSSLGGKKSLRDNEFNVDLSSFYAK